MVPCRLEVKDAQKRTLPIWLIPNFRVALPADTSGAEANIESRITFGSSCCRPDLKCIKVRGNNFQMERKCAELHAALILTCFG